ncbi:Cu(I)-responsive transcriptional regulator [Tianweitania sediminis]|uniref:Cu(I)-responsive transcriptional regulator n=1 Tax=Tianweitania sediminis TaxID=1502156 RepID=A0A8J7UJH7_9HYPH|nr:Cu(I)-responsive transcriptional regulator [Tianweitania sediminis]MBP0441304.1 Cu(I)-responsive transcriptional regulator [Tianweitania sediminis]
MNIGEAAAATGISTKMIRYYEEIGVIKSALRTSSGYRVYTDPEIHTLRFVRRARDLGFSVKQISSLLKLWRDRNRASADVKAMALGHVAELERKMQELKEMTSALRHLAENCHGDDMPDCPILHELGCTDCADPVPPKRQRTLGRGFEVVS